MTTPAKNPHPSSESGLATGTEEDFIVQNDEATHGPGDLPDWQKKIIDAAIAEIEADPSSLRPAEEVLDELDREFGPG